MSSKKACLIVGVVVFLLFCLIFSFPWEILWDLATGWVFYLIRVLPQLRADLGTTGTAMVCFFALPLGLHLFLSWFWRARPDSTGSAWPFRWTIVILAVVMLMFIAGISAVGITHQTAWLVTSPEPLFQSGRRDAARIQSANNLKITVLAMCNYADEHKSSLPPAAIRDSDGRPLLSWRVLLLPYLEQQILFNEFKLDEPWDSPHNLRLLNRMPKVYAVPVQDEKTLKSLTHYQVFVGPGTAFEGPTGLRLPQDFPNGTSNTIFIAEAAEPVPWTKPEDLKYEPRRPPPPLADFWHGKGANVAFADDHVRLVSRNVSDATLRAAIVRNSQDRPGDDW